MASKDTNFPQDMLNFLAECIRWTGFAFNGLQDTYVQLTTRDLRSTYVILAKRLSSVALYPEATWRNLRLCASCLGTDAIRPEQWHRSVHAMPGQIEDSLLAKMHTHHVLDGLKLSGRLEDLTWWELTAKMMARALTLLDGVSQVEYPYDKRLDASLVADDIFGEIFKGFFDKFFIANFQRNRSGHHCVCTQPCEVQPCRPDAFSSRFSVLARGGRRLELREVEEVVVSN